MAINKIVDSTSLTIEIQNGVDKAGDPTYSKKTFPNVRNDADEQNLYDVSEAMKAVIEGSTRDTLVNVTSNLINS